jgi:hypothetical protein
LLFGQYAFFAQGAAAMAGSFNADGTGHLAGLAGTSIAGSLDINDGNNPPQNITLAASDAGTGFYTVGPDPAGVGDVGCLDLYGADGSSRIFRFALGNLSGGIAQAGRITEYDDQAEVPTGVPLQVSGPLLRQDSAAFFSGDTSHLQTNYAFGLAGSVGLQASMAGALVLDPATGAITNSDFDSDEPGAASAPVQSGIQGSTGSITSVSAQTGRALFSFNVLSTPVQTNDMPGGLASTHAAVYIVNANEFLLVSLDPAQTGIPGAPPTWVYAGRAIVSGSAFSLSSLAGNSIYHAAGSQVNLGLLNFNVGNVTGTIFGYDPTGGATTSTVASETYAVDAAFGRVVLAGTGLTNPPIFYLATPAGNTETIEAFASGTAATGTASFFGLLEPGAAGNVTTSSLAGNYYLGYENLQSALNGPGVNGAGALGISIQGAMTGTEFDNGLASSSPFVQQNALSGTVTIDNAMGPGTGNVGANTVVITNGSKLFYINETTGAPASIAVVEHQ